MQGLASLPGGGKVDVISRKLPRVGPAEANTGYIVSTRSFQVEEIPQQQQSCSSYVQPDSEEVIIRLRGRLEEPVKRSSLLNQLHQLFAEPDLRHHWDVRTYFKPNAQPELAYELMIVSHAAVSVPEPLS
jgi:hypothetical protein